MPKKPVSLRVRKPRPAKARLPEDRESAPPPPRHYRRSIAEIIDEYHDGRATTIRRNH